MISCAARNAGTLLHFIPFRQTPLFMVEKISAVTLRDKLHWILNLVEACCKSGCPFVQALRLITGHPA